MLSVLLAVTLYQSSALQFIRWMTKTIKRGDMTVIFVTHDRAFMDAICTKILELDNGKGHVHDVGGKGAYERFKERRKKRRDAQQAEADSAKVCSFQL